MTNLSIIVAVAQNLAIGKDNDLLWHISADLKHFKALTTGHTIVMGRRTFHSLPRKPLPKRRNIVLTHDEDFLFPGVEVAHDIPQLLRMTEGEEEVFVMGGATLYRQLLPLAGKLYVTWVHRPFDGDVFFPPFEGPNFRLCQSTEPVTDEPSGLVYHYADYERVEN